jgi:hypothetical protein
LLLFEKEDIMQAGDRVICIKEVDGNSYIIGKKGTIITQTKEGTNKPLVEFDKRIMNGHTGGERGKNYHCWWCWEQCLEPIRETEEKIAKAFENTKAIIQENGNIITIRNKLKVVIIIDKSKNKIAFSDLKTNTDKKYHEIILNILKEV